jgi:lipopolysaccharide transport system ATP-binding protein
MSFKENKVPVDKSTKAESIVAETSIEVVNLAKCYQIYDKPQDRFKQLIFGKYRKYYKEFWALSDISFEVKRGETVGIIGRNGSGKSTLLQVIAGTLQATKGAANIKGRVAALLELGAGFNPEFTGRENALFNAQVLGLSAEQAKERLDDMIAFADIGEFVDRPVKTYSSGMYVRMAFSVIAHVDADVLIIDEALAVGDTFFTQKCMRFLRNFMKTGTVLFVSHDTSAIRNLCSKAIWLEEGKVLASGEAKQVCDEYLKAFFETQQGKSTTFKLKERTAEPVVLKDLRQDLLVHSNLRNDLRVISFDINAAGFGDGRAQIIDVHFQDLKGAGLSWVVGGEQVSLSITVEVEQALTSPIIGFYIKDRLGQTLFGDNTYLSYMDTPVHAEPGEKITGTFSFVMPILPAGDYAITVAIAEGTQTDHSQLHWIHDALIFRSETSSIQSGLIGIPMQKVLLEKH